MTLLEIQQKIQNAKALDFGNLLNACIELFKKIWVQGLVMLLLTMVIIIPVYLIMYVPLIAAGIIDPEILESGGQPNLVVLIPFYILMFIVLFIVMVVAFGMKAAFYRICKSKDYGEASIDDYFYFFKKPFLGKTIKIAAIASGITLLATLLCILPLFYVMVPVTLMSVVYAFNPEWSASDVVKASFDLGNKKWFLIFGLTMIASFLGQTVGMLLCFVGIFATASFVYLPVYFVYKEVIGFEETKKEIEA